MQFGILGPLQVVRDGAALDLGRPKQRALLALLLAEHGRPVPVDTIVDVLWGDEPPSAALPSLQAYVSNLRRVLEPERPPRAPAEVLVTAAPGYLLDVDDDDLDAARFERLLAGARTSFDRGGVADADTSLSEALSLWRGRPLPELRDATFARAVVTRLEELHGSALELSVAVAVASGRYADALADAELLVRDDPFRERVRWLTMLALHRAGRSVEALEHYRRFRGFLDDETGLAPGRELQELQQAILAGDPALERWPSPSPAAPGVATPATVPVPSVPSASPATSHAGVGGISHPATEPLVGRDDEVATLVGALEGSLVAGPRWVVLVGEPGIGKTHLARHLAGLAEARGAEVVTARCPDDDGVPALWPVAQALRAVTGGGTVDVLAPPGGEDAAAARYAMYEAVRDRLADAARRAPLMLLIDDVQWADVDTLALLRFLAGQLDGAPILVVLTVRDEGLQRDPVQQLLAAVARRTGSVHVEVPPLDRAGVAALLAAVGGTPEDEEEVAELQRWTGGNPFFVGEYGRLPAAQRRSGVLPAGIRSVLAERLGRLAPRSRALLELAAVLGEEFDLQLLAAASGEDTTTVVEGLEGAAADRVIVPRPTTPGYAFAHALLRDAVLAELSDVRRRQLHADVARQLDGTGGAVGRQAQLAHHLMEASPLVAAGRVADACAAAAVEAEAQLAFDAASRWWSAALRTVRDDPVLAEDDDRVFELLVQTAAALTKAGRSRTALDLLADATDVAMRTADLEAVGRVAAVLPRLGGGWVWVPYGEEPPAVVEQLQRAADTMPPDDSPARVRILGALAIGRYYRLDPRPRDDLSAEALAMARRLGDPALLGEAITARLLATIGVADHLDEAQELIDETLALTDRMVVPAAHALLAHYVAVDVHLTRGDTSAAEAALARGFEVTERLGLRVPRAQLQWAKVALLQWRGHHAAAEALIAATRAEHELTELYYSEGSQAHLLLWTRWEQGRVHEEPEAIATMAAFGWTTVWEATSLLERGRREEARDLVEAPGAFPAESRSWSWLGNTTFRAHLVADVGTTVHLERLRSELAPYEQLVAAVGGLGMAGPVSLALGRLAASAGEVAEARRLYDEAVAVAERAGSPTWATRARFHLAELLLAGERERARALLEEAAVAADRLGMARVAGDARSLLDRTTPSAASGR